MPVPPAGHDHRAVAGGVGDADPAVCRAALVHGVVGDPVALQLAVLAVHHQQGLAGRQPLDGRLQGPPGARGGAPVVGVVSGRGADVEDLAVGGDLVRDRGARGRGRRRRGGRRARGRGGRAGGGGRGTAVAVAGPGVALVGGVTGLAIGPIPVGAVALGSLALGRRGVGAGVLTVLALCGRVGRLAGAPGRAGRPHRAPTARPASGCRRRAGPGRHRRPAAHRAPPPDRGRWRPWWSWSDRRDRRPRWSGSRRSRPQVWANAIASVATTSRANPPAAFTAKARFRTA